MTFSNAKGQYANELVITDARGLIGGKVAGKESTIEGVLLLQENCASGSGFQFPMHVLAERVEALGRKCGSWSVTGGCGTRSIRAETGSRFGIGSLRIGILFRMHGRKRHFRGAYLGGCTPEASD